MAVSENADTHQLEGGFLFFSVLKVQGWLFYYFGWNLLLIEVEWSFVIDFKRVGVSPLILAVGKTEGSFLLTAYDLLTEFEIH